MKTTLIVLSLAIFCFFSLTTCRTVSIPLKRAFVEHDAYPFFNPKFRAAATLASNQSIGGNILPQGIYWTEVAIGSPPQYFNLAVDSGSTDLLLPQVDCDGCHINVTGDFDPTTSSTYNSISCRNRTYSCDCTNNGQCGFSASYETCNLTDPTQACTVYCNLGADIVGLGDESADFVFGLIYRQTKNFQQFFYIDGVIGFIPDDASSFGGTSAFEKFVRDGKYDNVFAMCLNPNHGGVLTLGGTNSRYQTGDFSWTPRANSAAFVVTQTDMLVGGKSVGLTVPATIIVDSGTNVLLQSQQHFQLIYKGFVNQLCPNFPVEGVCESTNLFTGQCYSYSSSDLQQFPTFSLQLKGATLTVNASQYLTQDPTTGQYCLGIKNTGNFGLNIIGDVIMQAYYTVFDQVNNRLGWAPVNYETCLSDSMSNNVLTL